MLNEASVEQLLAWSREPGLLPRVPASPCRGKAWTELRLEELQTLTQERDSDCRFSALYELRRRGEAAEVEPKPDVQGLLV